MHKQKGNPPITYFLFLILQFKTECLREYFRITSHFFFVKSIKNMPLKIFKLYIQPTFITIEHHSALTKWSMGPLCLPVLRRSYKCNYKRVWHMLKCFYLLLCDSADVFKTVYFHTPLYVSVWAGSFNAAFISDNFISNTSTMINNCTFDFIRACRMGEIDFM